ncbi:MAG: repeat-containing protein [Alphaproteobacteria bacterium]|jgi:Flp pilus assembly protein TadD|nr:repeat-containing protein [Alphaproteobacteria bacterium]
MAVETKQPGPPGGGAITLQQLFARGAKLHQAGNYDDAIAVYRRLVVAAPRHGASWTNLGVLWRIRKKPDLAVICHRQALAIDSSQAGAWSNLGNALKDLERFEEALAAHRRAVELSADSALHWHNFGVTLREAGLIEEAVRALDRAIEIQPEHVDAHWDRGLCNLSLGRYGEAWPDYAWRWRLNEMKNVVTPQAPLWDGAPLDGRTLLLHAEQGFGDTILALRYLPKLSGLGGRIILHVQAEVVRLAGKLPNVDLIVPRPQPAPPADVRLPLMDLLALYTPSPEAIPDPAPLAVPADAGGKALGVLHHFRKRFKIGVVWSGSVTFKNNHRRAVDLQRFLPFGEIPDVQLFSLQKGPPFENFKKFDPAPAVVDLGSLFQDFADTAAALRQLDLVIMTDSSVAHLAASLGVPVWNLLNFQSYWIYAEATGMDTTPWYGSMRLFRQPSPSKWDGVFEQVRQALEMHVAAWRASGGGL